MRERFGAFVSGVFKPVPGGVFGDAQDGHINQSDRALRVGETTRLAHRAIG